MDKDFILGMQRGFLHCAEWADGSHIADYDENTKYQEGNGFSKRAIKIADKFVKKFYKNNKKLLIESGLEPEQCGHDLWLTTQGHGTGFWDRGLGNIGKSLTEKCEKLGLHIFANDNGLLELE